MDEQVQAQEEIRGERSDLRDQLAEIVSLLSEKGKEEPLLQMAFIGLLFRSIGC